MDNVCSVISGGITRLVLRVLDRITPSEKEQRETPDGQSIGRRGEEDAYFYLRRLGYVMVARNFRSPRHHGEIDLIGWDRDVLCFIEVKTRTSRDVKTAEAAVDRAKRHTIRRMVADYLRSLPQRVYPEPPAWRFDVLTVYYEAGAKQKRKARRDLRMLHPTFELFRNAALSS
jgi:putative endonuclease